MTLGLADFFPPPNLLVGGTDFHAGQLNRLIDAIQERADALGVEVTLPEYMPDDTPIPTLPGLEALFQTYLPAMRTAIETILAEADFLAWDQGPPMQWVAWTKATLCGFTYQFVGPNLPYMRFDREQTTVAGVTQSGTFTGGAVDPGTGRVRFPGLDAQDNGAGAFEAAAGSTLAIVSSSINYTTGAWSIETDEAAGADLDINAEWKTDAPAVLEDWLWYGEGDPDANWFHVGYLNQLVAAVCALRYVTLTITTHSETSASSFYDDHVSEEGGDPVWWGPDTWGQCVAGANQSDTTQYGDITPNTFQMTLGDYMGGVDPWIWVADDGGGGLVKIAGNIGLVGGALDYDTGEWDVQVDTAMVAGYDTQQYYLYTPAASYECVLSIDNGGGSITLPKACVNVFLPVQRHRTNYAPDAFGFTTPAAGVYRMFTAPPGGDATYTDKTWYELPTITQEVNEVLAHACAVWSQTGAGQETGPSAVAAYAAALAESGITSPPEGWTGGELAAVSESGVRLDVEMIVVGDLHFTQKIGSIYDLSEFRQS